jgi:hypothetical protein
MTRICAVVATIDAILRPTGLCINHSLVTAGVRPKTDLISQLRHKGAPNCGVMHLVIAVGLRVFVDDEVWQSVSP